WKAHPPIQFEEREYGQKDTEFWKFAELPMLTAARLELAVSGKDVPRAVLEELGWRLRDAKEITLSVAGFERYVAASRGEFSVCKNVFLAMRTGWFSDRSAVYLASGRPAIVQDTGFSDHLPCGDGLFAVNSADEAAAAIDAIQRDWPRHSRAALSLAREYLECERVLGTFLEELGV
ncbi:MAG: glycosyltransferase family 1 protein, partial [Planctomycetota bacterium]